MDRKGVGIDRIGQLMRIVFMYERLVKYFSCPSWAMYSKGGLFERCKHALDGDMLPDMQPLSRNLRYVLFCFPPPYLTFRGS
jgi:hypothetical protein